METADQSGLGLTAPMTREVEAVTTRSETRTTHAPRRASQLPLTLDDSTFAGDMSPEEYALLHLAPAITTTVVTTTTETKTTFAPIRIPRSRAIRPAYSSFSGPSGADAPRADVPLTPRATLRRFIEADEANGGASSSALQLDPKLYPLSQAAWPAGFKQFNVDLGGMRATFYEDSSAAPMPAAGRAANPAWEAGAKRDPKGKGKERAVEQLDELAEPASAAGAFALSRAERGSLQQRRNSRRPRGSMTMSAAEGMEAEGGVADGLEPSSTGRLSPGPPRKRPRAESTALDRDLSNDSYSDPAATAAAAAAAHAASTARRPSQHTFLPTTPANTTGATTLPSPHQSPPSPVPTFGGDDSQDFPDDDESSLATRLHQINPQAFDFGSGAAFSGLLSLPDLVNTFDQLTPSLQSYLIFQLLRRSSIPVLQTLNQIIEPSLRRDFLADFPPELGVQVLCCLDAKTLCRASLVSKKWRRLIDGEWRVWKEQLLREGLWVGDGSEEKEAREFATGSSENLFLKRWRAGIWDEKRNTTWNGKVEAENLYISGVGGEARRPSVSHRLASPSSSREASPFPPSHAIHPFKLLYRRRFLTRQNWKYNTPRRTTFPSAPNLQPNAPNPNSPVVTCLQFDKDKVVSASDDHSINVFDTQTGALRTSLAGHEGGVWALQYVGNVLVSGSTDRTVRVWDLDTGRCTHVFVGHTSTVRCLQIVEPQNVNPDPTGPPKWQPDRPLIVTGSRDWSLRIWNLPMPGRDQDWTPPVPPSPTEENTEPSRNPFHRRHLPGHHHAVRALAAHGNTLVSGSYDMDVRVWDIQEGRLRHRLSGHSQKVYSVVYDHLRQQCASGSMDGTVRLWSTTSGQCLAVLEGHTSLVGLLGLSHRNLVSAAADWTLRIWDPETGRCKHALAAHQGAITCFQHDEYKVISGSDGTLKMWDVATGDFVRDLLTNLTGVWQVAFDQRFCVAAVARNNVSEFEILDFGAVDPDPPVRERYASPFVKREEDDEDYGFSAVGGSASVDNPGDITMSELPSRDATALAGAAADDPSSIPHPSAPRLRPAGFASLPSASSSATSLLVTGSSGAGPRSSTTDSGVVAGPSSSSSSSRTVRRTNESRDLVGQARAQAGGDAAAADGMDVERGGEDSQADEELDDAPPIKAEEVDEEY
ncbi:hypothetical protein JCM6882_007916 [Rhodosporidiobolus microsporus]